VSFDIYAFDLFSAPHDRHDFLDWVRRGFRDVDGPLGFDPTRLTPALKAWQAELAHSFPSAADPNRFEDDSPNAARNASYRCAQNIVQASFDWNASGPALYRAKRAAQIHAVGLFEASSADGAVWMISSRGRWEVVHRADERGCG
jgi:hypothetical protein